jgi:FlaA1/EpsC-like NDP-sugar epimerase
VNLHRATTALRHALRRIKPARSGASCAIEIAELLGRKPINLDTPELQRFLAGKRELRG